MQERLMDYGASVTTGKVNRITNTLFSPGILAGGKVEITRPNTIRVPASKNLPFSVVTPYGVILIEDNQKDLVFSLTAEAKNYTVVFQYKYQAVTGGSLGEYVVHENLFDQEHFNLHPTVTGDENQPHGTIIFWLKYPGSSVALNASMIYQPRPMKITEPSGHAPQHDVLPPFETKWFKYSTQLTNPSISSKYDAAEKKTYTKVMNTTSSPVPLLDTRVIPVVAGPFPPSIIYVRAKLDYGAALFVSVLDESGQEWIPYGLPLINTEWTTAELKLDNTNGSGTFVPGTIYHVKLDFELPAQLSAYVQSVAVSDFNLPI